MTKKQMDRMIGQIYNDYCAGMTISVMRIPELFREARSKIERGIERQDLGRWMVEYVDQEKL